MVFDLHLCPHPYAGTVQGAVALGSSINSNSNTPTEAQRAENTGGGDNDALEKWLAENNEAPSQGGNADSKEVTFGLGEADKRYVRAGVNVSRIFLGSGAIYVGLLAIIGISSGGSAFLGLAVGAPFACSSFRSWGL